MQLFCIWAVLTYRKHGLYARDQYTTDPTRKREHAAINRLKRELYAAPFTLKARMLLRGGIVNRTCGIHKNLPGIYLTIYFSKQYLVLLTMVPRNNKAEVMETPAGLGV